MIPKADSGENLYLILLQDILETGTRKSNRTGIDTLGLFGAMLKFDLREGFPLLTTKKVFWKGVVEELMWFIRGETNIKSLQEKGVKIWDEWADKETGDVGPIYSKQWRNWMGPYKDKQGLRHATSFHRVGEDKVNLYPGYDQLENVIAQLKKDPSDRRMIVSTWNPVEIPHMGLPPCHVLFQFNVIDEHLNCAMYQRSCDMFLGVPFNIASYALLTHMVAHLVGLKAGVFTHFLADAHIYVNHIDQVKEQLIRTPRELPQLFMADRQQKTIDDFKSEDFTLANYRPWPPIKGEVAV